MKKNFISSDHKQNDLMMTSKPHIVISARGAFTETTKVIFI